MTKTRIAIIVLGTVLVGSTIACGNAATSTDSGGSSSSDPGYTASIAACSASSAGFATFDVNLTNTGKSSRTFFIKGEILDGNGTRLSDASGISNDLGAGQTAIVHMIASGGALASQCKISGVS